MIDNTPKTIKITQRCFEMLKEAMEYYIYENAPKQAKGISSQFFETVKLIESMPGIGTIYEDGMKKFPLGKYPYLIYYKEHESYISIRGIWHTSRGSNFEDNNMDDIT